MSPTAVLGWARSPGGQRWIRYSAVSVVAVAVSQACLLVLVGAFHWTARSGNITATAVGTVPSYTLNRSWAWGKTGRSHLMKEVVPFWVLAFIGLAFSTWAADYAGSATRHSSHAVHTLAVMAGSLGAFGVLWVGKFLIFNKLLFASDPAALDDQPALDGRTGLPT